MSASIRHSFEAQLAELQEDVVRMGGLASEAVQAALQALTTRDLTFCDRVMEIENRIDAINLDIEERALQLLALQQPMARDLRTIAAVLRMIADLERIGDYSVDVSRQARELAQRPRFAPEVDIPRIAHFVQQMLHQSLEALVRRDLDLAAEAVRQDDEVDRLYKQLHLDLADRVRQDPSQVEQAFSLLLIGAYLERVADHITNIGERIWFIETGALKELHE